MKPLIFNQMLRFIRLHFLYLKISLTHLSVYRISAFLSVVFSFIFLMAEVLTVNVYYSFVERIGDWEIGSFYILLGTFNIMVIFYTYLFEIPHDDFVLKIRYGELDASLIKPMDSLALSSIQRVDFSSLFNLPIPIWLLFKGATLSGHALALEDVFLYLLTLINGVFILYLINQFFVNLSFWTTEISNITAASDQIVQLGSKPLQVYPKVIQLGFSYVIPILLSINLSVEAIKGQLKFASLLVLISSTFVFFMLIRLQWKWGLQRYSSASS